MRLLCFPAVPPALRALPPSHLQNSLPSAEHGPDLTRIAQAHGSHRREGCSEQEEEEEQRMKPHSVGLLLVYK